MSLSIAVREELAHLSPGERSDRLAETASLLRLAGSAGADARWVVSTPCGSVARRAHRSLTHLFGVRPDVDVSRAGTASQGLRYRLYVERGSALEALGVTDASGRPSDRLPTVARPPRAVAALRGAMMAAGIVSDPAAQPHLEIRSPSAAIAHDLAGLLGRLGAGPAKAGLHGDDWRVVMKSGEAIGALLARLGAHTCFLHWDQARLRRSLRGEANRNANADRANVRRAVSGSTRQVQAIEVALSVLDWPDIPPLLQQVALARLANPTASLSEVGTFLDPPVGKATVHRRIARLTALAEAAGTSGW